MVIRDPGALDGGVKGAIRKADQKRRVRRRAMSRTMTLLVYAIFIIQALTHGIYIYTVHVHVCTYASCYISLCIHMT